MSSVASSGSIRPPESRGISGAEDYRLDASICFRHGLAVIALANPDPLAREALCIHLSACFYSPNAAYWNSLMYEIGLGAAVRAISRLIESIRVFKSVST